MQTPENISCCTETQKSSTQRPTKFRSNTTSGSCYQKVRNTRRSFSRRWCFWHCSSSCSTLVCASTEKAHRIERSINFVCVILWSGVMSKLEHCKAFELSHAEHGDCSLLPTTKNFYVLPFFLRVYGRTWPEFEPSGSRLRWANNFLICQPQGFRFPAAILIVRSKSAFIRSRRLGNKKMNVMMIRVSLNQI